MRAAPSRVLRPTREAARRFPALDWLLREHGPLLRGAILTPPRTREHEGSIAAATTACAFEDAMALTPELAEALRADGWDLPVLGDTRGLDNLAALRWTLGRYAHDLRRCTRLMGFTHGGRPTYMVDYWVATRSLCFYLDARLADEAASFAEILRPDIVPPGTILYGDVEGTYARRVTQQLGYTVSAGDLCNLSVTSSIPSDPAKLRRPSAPCAAPLDPDAVYVSWNGFDGDCPIGVGAFGFLALREAPPDADAPFGIWFHPHMLDLFPTMAQWWSERGHGQLDIVASLNDGGVAPWTEAGRTGWRESYRSVLQRANGLFQVFNVFYETEDNVQEVLAGPLDWPFVILGYNCEHYLPEEGATRWKLLGNTVYCNQGCRGGGTAGANAIRAAIAGTHAGTPAFVMAKQWGPHGRFLESATEAMRALQADPPPGRRLVFLPPRDLAATWRTWAASARPEMAASVWPGPNGVRFRPSPLHPSVPIPFRPRPFDKDTCTWRQCGETAPLDPAFQLGYAERLHALRATLADRPADRLVVSVEVAPGKEAAVRRFHLLQAIEVAAAGAADAFQAATPAAAAQLQAELRQFHGLRDTPVLVT